MFNTKNFLKINRQKGQGMIEYAFILILVAVVAIVGLKAIEGSVNNSFCKPTMLFRVLRLLNVWW